MGSLKSKAQRENKFRDGDAGSTFSAAELAEVKAKNAAFVKKTSFGGGTRGEIAESTEETGNSANGSALVDPRFRSRVLDGHGP